MDPGALWGWVAIVPLIAVWAWALVDVARAEPWAVRAGSKELWIVVVVLFTVLGAVLWVVLGRPVGRR